jgi:thiol-disulfide isomerase/thioredoxin
MSNTAYSKPRRVPRDFYKETPTEDEPYEESEEEYEDEEPEQEAVGLFSTPARTAALVTSVVVLVFVAVAVAWLLGQKVRGPISTAGVVPNNIPVKAAPRVGALAPDFELSDVRSNKPLKLSSLRGKPVLVNFWGTWCPPCREEMPALEKIYEKVKGQVEFLGVSMGPRDEPMGVNQFVKLNNYTWTFIHDTDSSVSINYQVTGIPSTFFIDKNGVIRSIHVGGAASEDLENGLKKAEEAQ